MPEIVSMLAFIVTEEDGNEVAIGTDLPGVGWIPLIAAGDEQVEKLTELAAGVAAERRTRVRVVRFTKAEVLQTIDGTDA